ncbi:MAG TPA: DegT/DnrJ/EryC1/StrS family aminotransferase [Longimicrobium sp.]|nr:DegT/DnrJ/EryC1/StrS family aminotransferase [Longimicrobium sp.]
MTLRRLPPVHSPLPARALAAGLRGALGLRDDRRRVDALIRRDWGSRDVESTRSGTAALTLALASDEPARPRAPVALPAYGCYDLATAARGAARRVVLYDLDLATLQPHPESFARALAAEPSAVVVVHLFGIPVNVPALAPAVAAAGALLVEDAAQGAGARVQGRPAGALGDVSVLSFGRGKGMTGGGGGALLAGSARGEALVRRARRALGGAPAGWGELTRAGAMWGLARPWLYALPASLPFLRLGETVYQPPRAPEPMSRASAAIVAAAWEHAGLAGAARERNARRLGAAAALAGERVPAAPPGCRAGWLRLPVLNHVRRRAETGAARALGIMPGYPRALCDFPGFAECCVNGGDNFDGARELADGLYTLPTHALLGEADLRRIEAWLGAADAVPALAAAGSLPS